MSETQNANSNLTVAQARLLPGALLSVAAAKNDVATIRALLKIGISPNEPCPCCDGLAIHSATQAGGLEAAEVLLRAGAIVPDYVTEELGLLPRKTRRATLTLLRRFGKVE